MAKLKKNDKVVVITGKDKGKQGEIIAICRKSNRVKVKDVHVVTRHVKARRQGERGSIQKTEAYIHASNVMPLDSLTGKPVRLNKLKRS